MNQISNCYEVFNLNHKLVEDLFDGVVTVEEKADGSNFSFKLDLNRDLICRSRRQLLDINNPPKMFAKAVNYVKSIANILLPGVTYRGEVLDKPKHNVIAYSRVPEHNIVIFDIDVRTENYLSAEIKESEAKRIGLECVPCFVNNQIVFRPEDLKKFLEKESFLGGSKIEGIVIKNYNKFGQDKKILCGKIVSEEFKERHNKEWKVNSNKKDVLTTLCEMYRNENRWKKAIQRLRDEDKLVNEMKDMAVLVPEVINDIRKEEENNIKDLLFNWAWPIISKKSVNGLAEFYKDYILKLER